MLPYEPLGFRKYSRQ